MAEMMKGNIAIAEAAVRAGVRLYAGYPITPSSEIMEYLSWRLPEVGGAFVQAESELAGINMVYGASSCGVRVLTASSGPGISLKQEGISVLSDEELPALVINVVRYGNGLGTLFSSQCDYLRETRGGGNGDYRCIVLCPSSIQEAVDMVSTAYELGEKYRVVVVMMTEGALGQMMEPVVLDVENVKTIEKPWAVTGTKCEREHNIINSLSLVAEELEQWNFNRYDRYAKIQETETRCEEFMTEDADIIVVAFGIAARVSKNAVVAARKEGIKVGMIRPITLWPFPKKELAAAAEKAKRFISVELSMGQMIEDVELAIRCSRPVDLCCRVGGVIPSPEEVLDAIRKANK